MKRTRCLLGLAVLNAGWIAGCSTPAARIRANPEVFASLPAAEQALVQEGRIRKGFDPAAVRLALGEPDRIITQTDDAGPLQTWLYIARGFHPEAYDFRSSPASESWDPNLPDGYFDLGYHGRYAGLLAQGSSRPPLVETWVSTPYFKTVIGFRNGKVARIIHGAPDGLSPEFEAAAANFQAQAELPVYSTPIARQHIGEIAIVSGMVMNAVERKGEVLFDLDGVYPHEGFTVAIKPVCVPAIGNYRQWIGKTLRVRGIILKGQNVAVAKIWVTSPTQLIRTAD